MKTQADKNRQERQFQVGDWVYVRLQPYVQWSVQSRANHKLSFKYFGPYLILQKVGQVIAATSFQPNSSGHSCVSTEKGIASQVTVSADDELNLLTLFLSLPPVRVLGTGFNWSGDMWCLKLW